MIQAYTSDSSSRSCELSNRSQGIKPKHIFDWYKCWIHMLNNHYWMILLITYKLIGSHLYQVGTYWILLLIWLLINIINSCISLKNNYFNVKIITEESIKYLLYHMVWFNKSCTRLWILWIRHDLTSSISLSSLSN